MSEQEYRKKKKGCILIMSKGNNSFQIEFWLLFLGQTSCVLIFYSFIHNKIVENTNCVP